MKPLLYLILIACLIESCDNINLNSHKNKYIYITPHGGIDTVKIDTDLSLKKLIKNLEKPWEFKETRKAYWIGYTDDMFAIAYHEDKAIKPLLDLINKTDSSNTKLAAILTLHLIGIKSHIAGRTYEEFKDTLARNAIITLLENPQLHKIAIGLLRRDPWSYDIPYFMDYLSKPDKDYSYILSALPKYQIDFKELPLWQILPKDLWAKQLVVYSSDTVSETITNLIALKNALNNKMVIDKEILESKEWRDGQEVYRKKTGRVTIPWMNQNMQIYKRENPTLNELNSIGLEPHMDYTDYLCYSHDKRFIYSYNNDSLYIYSPKKAREILIKWWNDYKKLK